MKSDSPALRGKTARVPTPEEIAPDARMPSREAIARRAHELWEKEGRPEGKEQEHWYLAEKELMNRSKGSGGPRQSS